MNTIFILDIHLYKQKCYQKMILNKKQGVFHTLGSMIIRPGLIRSGPTRSCLNAVTSGSLRKHGDVTGTRVQR